jgi:transposase-like protein
MARESVVRDELPLEDLACPNGECAMFNCFGAGNLSVAERMGKGKAIRRLYCNCCGHRFSERQGSLMRYTHLPADTVERVVKCLTYGNSIEATADICGIDPRSVSRILERGGQRAEDFQQLQLHQLQRPPQVVELDELHAKVARPPGKKGGREAAGTRTGTGTAAGTSLVTRLAGVGRRAATGFTWPWK